MKTTRTRGFACLAICTIVICFFWHFSSANEPHTDASNISPTGLESNLANLPVVTVEEPIEAIKPFETVYANPSSDGVKMSSMAPKAIMDMLHEETPVLPYTCPYERQKCVATATFSANDTDTVTWDIYLFIEDGIIGTYIVNNFGRDIFFYGDAFIKKFDANVHIGEYRITESLMDMCKHRVCVYPKGDSFIVVTLN